MLYRRRHPLKETCAQRKRIRIGRGEGYGERYSTVRTVTSLWRGGVRRGVTLTVQATQHRLEESKPENVALGKSILIRENVLRTVQANNILLINIVCVALY